MKNFLFGAITIIVIVAVGIAAYYFGSNSSRNKVVTPAPYPLETMNPNITPTPSPTANDAELIKKALFDKHGWTDSDGITVQITTNDGTYASGSVSSQGGGGYLYAAKVNGVWQIVADGNGVITCESLTPYPDFPKTLIPECYDTATSKTVTR